MSTKLGYSLAVSVRVVGSSVVLINFLGSVAKRQTGKLRMDQQQRQYDARARAKAQ